MKALPVVLTLVSLFHIVAAAEPRKPNILLIVADDLGYGELGSQGFTQEIPTPHIDSIAAGGVRFTSGYVSGPYCSPTRAGLMTGRYQQRFGHEFNPGGAAQEVQPGLALTETTWGTRLKEAGYATGWFGKSHLGVTPAHHPQRRGFDEFYGFLGGAHRYVDAQAESNNPILKGTEIVRNPGYLTEEFATEAVDFIERKKQAPWFTYLAFNAVHTPLEVPERYLSRFAAIEDPKRRKFAGLLSALDDAVGRVLGKVRELGLEEDTLIYFISDNGGPTAQTTSSNGPLRGYKAQTWEGGIRVPFAIQWRGKIPAGKVDPRPVIQLDLLPTSLAAAGQPIQAEWKLDGVNLLPYLTGERTDSPHEALFWRLGSQLAVRKGDWKLVKGDVLGPAAPTENTGTAGAQLYHLGDDLGESIDLAAKHPEKVKELAAAWEAWSQELAAPSWLPGGARRKAGAKAAPVTAGPWKSGDTLTNAESPDVAGRGFAIQATLETAAGAEGVILGQGGSAHGYALHLVAGRPVFSVRLGGKLVEVTATEVLTPGVHEIRGELDANKSVLIYVDGKITGDGKLPNLLAKKPGEGLTVGSDGQSAVGNYTGGHAFTGKVTAASITRY
jgi:arylsulfatase A-like enzyme